MITNENASSRRIVVLYQYIIVIISRIEHAKFELWLNYDKFNTLKNLKKCIINKKKNSIIDAPENYKSLKYAR